jgi:ribonuclease HII
LTKKIGHLTVAQIRQRYLREGRPVTKSVLEALRKDSRLGVQQAYHRLQRQLDGKRKEANRLRRMQQAERRLWRRGLLRVAGVDEVGVGCIAGPVVAAAVVLAPGTLIAGLNDSKKLDASQRAVLAAAIRDAGAQLGIGVATVQEIGQMNVYHAGLLAMSRAVHALDPPAEFLLIDARRLPQVPIPQESVVGGDARHSCIAAASIIAKTHRDALLVELDKLYPSYHFSEHKGYCTPAHQQAIREHGCCPAHRQTYGFIQELTGKAAPVVEKLESRIERARSTRELVELEEEFGSARLPRRDLMRLRRSLDAQKTALSGRQLVLFEA